ncbi:MAG: HD domain-containing protein [Lachnospiraceae bacterium]|nr:HD domain-containing protein [Lachnospiraceae bacterium]
MALKMFAAIYVGSSELSLNIFEINGRKSFRKIDGLSRFIELGKDTYSDGVLSTASIKQVCEVLGDFKKKMKEYQITEYRAYATSAVREAKNSEIILETIKRTTNIDVKILSNSEQRYIIFKGVIAKSESFRQIASKNTALIDVGAGSIQISLFDKNNLIVSENMPIGAVRIRDYLSIIGNKSGRLDQVIAEFVDNDIATFRNIYLNDKEIKSIVAVGEIVKSFGKIVPEIDLNERISFEQFEKIYSRAIKLSPLELSEKYGIPFERATLILPNVLIYKSLLNNCKAESIYVPNVTFCEGIAASYMDEGSRVVFSHDFTEDIVASAFNLSKRYKCNQRHLEAVSDLALKIFDSVRKPYGMDKQERLLLKIAAILHDCGNFISMHNGAMSSYHIIANTEIIGLSHTERMEVANIVKYNIHYLPAKDQIMAELGDCDYMVIAKLVAILRIANILDKSHLQKIEDVSISIKDDNLIISALTYDDISLEAGLFEARADFFEQVYGIRPILRLKRSVK